VLPTLHGVWRSTPYLPSKSQRPTRHGLGTSSTKFCYISYRNKLISTLLAAEKLYYDQQFYDNSSNLKKTWAIIGNIINKPKRSLNNCQFDTSRGVITDEKEIAAEFN